MAIRARPGVVHHASEGDKFNSDTTLVVVNCPTCHVTHAIPKSLNDAAVDWPGDQERGWKLSCPLGHTWWYVGESVEQKAKRKIERAEADAKWYRDREARARAETDQAKADARAQKAAKTRIRNSRDRERQRAANGVCPCCNRTFRNLARHMAGQHPGWPKEGDE